MKQHAATVVAVEAPLQPVDPSLDEFSGALQEATAEVEQVMEFPGNYSIDGFPLRDGMRAAIGSGE